METWVWIVLWILTVGAVALTWVIGFRRACTLRRLQEEKQMAEQERGMVIEFMHHLVEAIGGGADRQELWQRVVHACVQCTGALSAAVFELQEGDQLKGVASEGLFPPHKPLSEFARMKLTTRTKFLESVLKNETFSLGEGIVGNVARTRKAELVEDASRDPRISQHDDPVLVVRSIIVCPILFRDKLLGVLAVANPADGKPFNRVDFSLVESLAEQAGLAVHNADALHLQLEKKRLDLELELASNIQSLLLPSVFPECPELDIAATYLPAQKVGGDLYDVFELDGGRLGVAIADVSGKGVPGSLLMAICQTNLRHFARQFDHPSEVLTAINREMMAVGMRRDKFVTMVYLIIDPRAGRLRLARAGHEIPLLAVHEQGDGGHLRLDRVESSGIALGMVKDDLFRNAIEDVERDFGADDVVLLYTDGVTEATNPEGTEYSLARLTDSMKVLHNRPAQEILDGLLAHVARFSGKETYEDDLTLMAIKHRG